MKIKPRNITWHIHKGRCQYIMLVFSGDVLYFSIKAHMLYMYNMHTLLYWRYFIYYVPTGFDMRKIAHPLSIVLNDISVVVYT